MKLIFCCSICITQRWALDVVIKRQVFTFIDKTLISFHTVQCTNKNGDWEKYVYTKNF